MKLNRIAAAVPLVVLAWTSLAFSVAGAQETPGEPAVQSWALAPSGTNPDEPGSRPNLSYELAPGASVDDSVTLFNYGNTPLTFRVYATDAFNTESGGFDLLTGEKAPVDAGSWVTLSQTSVVLPPLTQINLPFKMTVPPDAHPGDHAAAVLASSPVEGRDNEGRAVTLDRRTGSRLYVRVAGPLEPSLTVEKVDAVYHSALNPLGGSVDVAYTVRNTGNVRLGAHQRVLVENLFGRKMEELRLDDFPEILPGNTVTVRARLESVTAAVRVSAKPVLTPFPVGRPDVSEGAEARGTGRAWALPWTVIASIVLLYLLLQLAKWYRRRREEHGPSGPPGGSSARELLDVR